MESNLWKCVRGLLRPLGVHLVPVENPKWPGTPDCNWCYKAVEGWMELKHVPKWPARDHTPLRLPHFTVQQKLWIENRYRARGRVHVFLQVDKDYLLFSPPKCLQLGQEMKLDLYDLSDYCWTNKSLTGESLLKQLLERRIK